jgi:hypothetical protein
VNANPFLGVFFDWLGGLAAGSLPGSEEVGAMA